jgi:putative tryptophan/tyrosine transport system substrate-binding protein
MRRRAFIAGLGGAAAWPVVARAQSQGGRPLVAFLQIGPQETAAPYLSAFAQGMRALGSIEERDYDAINRFSLGEMSRMPLLANDLVRLDPSVMVTSSTAETIALKRVTATIPIVGTILSDPVGAGLAASYARPGGNVTGVLVNVDDLQTKLLQLALEVVPGCHRVGTLTSTTSQANMRFQRNDEATAIARLQLVRVPITVEGPAELDAAFESFVQENVQMVVIYNDPMLYAHRRKIAELALERRIPTVFSYRDYVEVGGLSSYGVNIFGNFHRAAAFVEKILKGARPADLPIEFPTRLDLVINLKTAKALGLEISPQLLARADEVIE